MDTEHTRAKELFSIRWAQTSCVIRVADHGEGGLFDPCPPDTKAAVFSCLFLILTQGRLGFLWIRVVVRGIRVERKDDRTGVLLSEFDADSLHRAWFGSRIRGALHRLALTTTRPTSCKRWNSEQNEGKSDKELVQHFPIPLLLARCC